MSRGVAVLKPDHLGDLILSAPAIRAIQAWSGRVTLFIAPGSAAMARFLFPGIADIRPVAFPHLMREPVAATDLGGLTRELDGYERLFCLRDDPVMRRLVQGLTIPWTLAAGDHQTHETIAHKRAIMPVVGDYSRTELFAGAPNSWPTSPKRVALCVSAGFPTNRWPNLYWRDLGLRLHRRGVALTLVGGPLETADLAMLSRLLAGTPHEIVQGADDFSAFHAAVAPADVAIATDSGAAHLLSLTKPICSVFASSPWRRYAPFGRQNRLITRDEVCSPCVQFSTGAINGCMTRECAARLRPAQVEAALLGDARESWRKAGARIERGVSHRERA